MADPDCIFCKIVAGELPATIVDEDERTIAFMDITPATRGHALVIPRAHSADLLSVDPEDLQRGGARRAAAGRRARRSASAPTASTCSTPAARAAWQTVFHFHVHVIPRYDGRSAAAAVGARAGRSGGDRGRRAGTRRAT